MLSAVGIIAEFNPFHNGHRYLLKQARRNSNADVIIVVMSGNWVQRGIPAIVDKWQRTRMAMANGADLVIELPTQFAVQPADIFAYQAVKLVDQLKCQWLAFGCEHPSLDFDKLANLKLKPVHQLFHNYRFTYATLIRKNFYQQTGIKITQPNDLLGLSYARSKRKLASNLKLMPVQRSFSHDSKRLVEQSEFTSSTAIRKELFSKNNLKNVEGWMPKACVKLMTKPWLNWQSFWPLLRYQLVVSPLSDLRGIYEMREGLEHRLKDAAVHSTTFNQFINSVKTKRYTYSAILRVCYYVLINLTQKDWQRIKTKPYLRILGFNSTGRKYLNQIKKSLSIPVITNTTQNALENYLQCDFKAGMLFQAKLHHHEDLYRHPVIK